VKDCGHHICLRKPCIQAGKCAGLDAPDSDGSMTDEATDARTFDIFVEDNRCPVDKNTALACGLRPGDKVSRQRFAQYTVQLLKGISVLPRMSKKLLKADEKKRATHSRA
jgi:hypothetical protein